MRKRLTNNIGYKFLSVIFAVMLWLTVLNVSDPQKTATITNIPITILNENAVTGQDKVYKIASGKTATVEVTGPRTIIDSLEPSSFKATVDLSKLSITNALEVDVELVTASYRSKVDIDVQTTMRIEVEDLIEEEYNVEVDYKSYGSLPDGYVVHETNIDVDSVKVKAPVSTMNKISKVAVRLDLSGVTEDFQVTEKLYAFDARGNIIDAEANNITFEVPSSKVDVVIYSVKQVPVAYEIAEENYEDTIFTGTEISHQHITIKGRKEALDAITELKLDTTSLQITPEEDVYNLAYDVQTLLPVGVYLYGDEKTITITVNTDAVVTKRYTVSVSDIAIMTPAEGYTAFIETTGDISYTLKGRKSILEAFEQEDKMLYVSAKNLVEGVYDLQVKLDLEEGITQVAIPSVKVKVVPKESSSVELPSNSDGSSEATTSSGNTTTEKTTEASATEGTSEQNTPSTEETTSSGDISPQQVGEAGN